MDFRIVSPIDGAKYFGSEFMGECRAPLRAEGSRGKVSWYVDGKYVGDSTAGKVKICSLHDGFNVISASDEFGRSAAVKVEVVIPGMRKSENESLF